MSWVFQDGEIEEPTALQQTTAKSNESPAFPVDPLALHDPSGKYQRLVQVVILPDNSDDRVEQEEREHDDVPVVCSATGESGEGHASSSDGRQFP